MLSDSANELAKKLYEILSMAPYSYILRYKTKKDIFDESSPTFISDTNHPDDTNAAKNNANNWITKEEYSKFIDGEFTVDENTQYESYTKKVYKSTNYNGTVITYDYTYGTDTEEANSKQRAEANGTNVTSYDKTFYKYGYTVKYKVEKYNSSSGTEESIEEYYKSEQECNTAKSEKEDIMIPGSCSIEAPSEGTPNFDAKEISNMIADAVIDVYGRKTIVGLGTLLSGTTPTGPFTGYVTLNAKPIILPVFKLELSIVTDAIMKAIDNLKSAAKDAMNSSLSLLTDSINQISDTIAQLKDKLNTDDTLSEEEKTNLLNEIDALESSKEEAQNSINDTINTASQASGGVKKLLEGE